MTTPSITRRRITAETEARETAESHGWMVGTRYTDGIADVRYQRGNETIRAVFSPSGRVKDFAHLVAGRMKEFVPSNDTGKRAHLLTLLIAPPRAEQEPPRAERAVCRHCQRPIIRRLDRPWRCHWFHDHDDHSGTHCRDGETKAAPVVIDAKPAGNEL